jgi:hypothetical protein
LKKDESQQPEQMPAEAKKDQISEPPRQAEEVLPEVDGDKVPDESRQGDAPAKAKKDKKPDQPQQPGEK